MRELTYHINLDERGEFYAHVEDGTGKEVYSIPTMDVLRELIEDGYMKHSEDIGGLCYYLRTIALIGPKDIVVFEEN